MARRTYYSFAQQRSLGHIYTYIYSCDACGLRTRVWVNFIYYIHIELIIRLHATGEPFCSSFSSALLRWVWKSQFGVAAIGLFRAATVISGIV